MLKPFNTEGLDMTFLSDSTYPDLGTTEASNMAAASNPMRGFTPEQTSSLQRMLSTSIGEALEPLLRPLSEFLSAWEKGPQSLSFNTSLTHSIFPDSSFEIQSSTADDSHNHLSPTELVKPSALESPTSPNDSSTKNAFQPNRAHPSNESKINPLAVPASSVDRVPAKRKATGLDEAVIVTFLFNYCPHLLYAFPNFTGHPEFSLTRGEAAGRGRREFSIERSGLTVTCSHHQPEYPEERKAVVEEQYDEEALVKHFDAISHEKMQFTYEMKPWGNKRTIERYAHAFGAFAFKSGMWTEGEGVTIEGGATSV